MSWLSLFNKKWNQYWQNVCYQKEIELLLYTCMTVVDYYDCLTNNCLHYRKLSSGSCCQSLSKCPYQTTRVYLVGASWVLGEVGADVLCMTLMSREHLYCMNHQNSVLMISWNWICEWIMLFLESFVFETQTVLLNIPAHTGNFQDRVAGYSVS